MGNEGFFKLDLFTVEGRPLNEKDVRVSFLRVLQNKVILTADKLEFPPERTFTVPAFPQEQNLICEVTPPRFRQWRSNPFTLTDAQTKPNEVKLFRRPDKFSADFIAWDQLPSSFVALKKILEKSSAVKFKGGRLVGKFTEGNYDGVTDSKEVLAKAALLNLFAKLTDLKEPVGGTQPWFSFVREIVEIGRERFIAIADPKLGEIVRAIKKDIGSFKAYKNTPAQNHFGNIPAVFQPVKSKMFSIKSDEDHGNIQITLAPGKDSTGGELLVLDADIDEDGKLLPHLGDLFKHKFTGGTHPFDIHEYLAISNLAVGYELV